MRVGRVWRSQSSWQVEHKRSQKQHAQVHTSQPGANWDRGQAGGGAAAVLAGVAVVLWWARMECDWKQ